MLHALPSDAWEGGVQVGSSCLAFGHVTAGAGLKGCSGLVHKLLSDILLDLLCVCTRACLCMLTHPLHPHTLPCVSSDCISDIPDV